MLAHTKPEMLLPLDEYTKLMAGNGPPLNRKQRAEVRRDLAEQKTSPRVRPLTAS